MQVCEHPVYDFCAMPEGESSGTCTQRCASDEDCELIQRGAESGNLAQTLELAHGVSELYIGTSRLLERELRERRREPA